MLLVGISASMSQSQVPGIGPDRDATFAENMGGTPHRGKEGGLRSAPGIFRKRGNVCPCTRQGRKAKHVGPTPKEHL